MQPVLLLYDCSVAFFKTVENNRCYLLLPSSHNFASLVAFWF